jgi:putative salt-induced outer membrane protein
MSAKIGSIPGFFRPLSKMRWRPDGWKVLRKKFHESGCSSLRWRGDFFDASHFMKACKLIAGCLLIWMAFSLPASAQDPTVMVTNFVTITITNIITVTNFVPPMAVAAKPVVVPATAAKIVPPPKPQWNSTITAGATLTRGNSDSLLSTAKLFSDKKTPNDEYSLGADATYGSANGVANNETYHGFGQWNHLFSPLWYGYLRGDGLHDGIAQVKYRFTITSGIGYYLVKQTNTTLALEAGPGIVIERLGFVDTTYATMRIAERFEHKFNKNSARIWENAEFLPQIDKPGDYLVNSEIGVESALHKNLSLQVFLDDSYNSQPASGFRRNDVKLVSGVSYKF